jgi:glycosyltransferase involved in cell wall biosynthesis
VPLVVCVGRLAPQKDHATAIRALASVPDACLAVVGDGPSRASLEASAADAGLADRVVFTGARDDARSVLGAADVALLPSRWEGLPLVALEAAAAGVPLVATSVRGIRELLTDGRDALLVPPGDAGALARAVTRVLVEPGLSARLVEGGAAIAAASTEERMVERFLALYAELVQR